MKNTFLYIIIVILLGCNSLDHKSREFSLNKYGQAYCDNQLNKNEQSLKGFFSDLGVELDELKYENQKLYAKGSELNLSRTQLVVDEINLDPEKEIFVEVISGPETIEFLTEEDKKRLTEEFGFEWIDKKKN